MYREILYLGLFVQTSPNGLGLYKKDLSPILLCTYRASEVNKKFIIWHYTSNITTLFPIIL
jgi:hypothetical protein